MTFRAAVLTELNKPLEIMELKIPELDVGQVLVEIYSAGICGAQIREISGAKGEDKYLPHLLGHEGCGIVKEIGPGVSTVNVGDRVVMHWRKGKGIDAKFPQYQTTWGNGTIGAGQIATFAEYAVVSENRVTTIPDYIPFNIGALLGCAATTGLGVILNEAKVLPGETVTVIGVGGVGLACVMGCSLINANCTAIDINEMNLREAFALGASNCILWPEIHTTQTDFVIDCTGNPEMINNGLCWIKPGGTLILVGQPPVGANVTFNDFQSHYYGKTIMDSQGGGTNPDKDIPRYLNLYKKKKLPLEKLISEKIGSLDSINTSIQAVQQGLVDGRCIIKMK